MGHEGWDPKDGTPRMGPSSSQGFHATSSAISYLSGVEVSLYRGSSRGTTGRILPAPRQADATSQCPVGKREGGRGQSTPSVVCPQPGVPTLLPTCHSKDQESGDCRDAESAGSEEEEEEEEDGLERRRHQQENQEHEV